MLGWEILAIGNFFSSFRKYIPEILVLVPVKIYLFSLAQDILVVVVSIYSSQSGLKDQLRSNNDFDFLMLDIRSSVSREDTIMW